jgi:hypothetical protein
VAGTCGYGEGLSGSINAFNSLTKRLFCSVLLPLFTVAGLDLCEEDWYASDNNLRGTPRGSRKKPKAGR